MVMFMGFYGDLMGVHGDVTSDTDVTTNNRDGNLSNHPILLAD